MVYDYLHQFFLSENKGLTIQLFVFKTISLNFECLYGRNLAISKALSTIIGTFQQKNRTICNFLRI